MNGYNFTERVRRVLAIAREEAAALKHDYVGTEHMLLGILREGEGVGVAALGNLSVDLRALQRGVLDIVKKGTATPTTDLPYTSRSKKVLELAMRQARDCNHPYVGTEHLLLGLLAEKRGVAAQVLSDAGVTLDVAREEILRILGTPPPDRVPRISTADDRLIDVMDRDPEVAELLAQYGITPHRIREDSRGRG